MSNNYIEQSIDFRRLSEMMVNDPKFLVEMADSLRRLADRAPDISRDLRRFADDLDRLASEGARRDEAEGTA